MWLYKNLAITTSFNTDATLATLHNDKHSYSKKGLYSQYSEFPSTVCASASMTEGLTIFKTTVWFSTLINVLDQATLVKVILTQKIYRLM